MIIESLEKRRIGTRYEIRFTDGVNFSVSRTMARKLSPGMDVDAAELREKARAQDTVNAREACVFMLGRSDKSRAELMRFLLVRGYDADIAQNAVDRLIEAGYVNDAALAERMAENNKAGKRALKQRMKQRGIGDDDAEAALNDIDDTRQKELATVLKEKLHAQGKDDMKIRAALARRGFSYDVINAVIRGEDFE